ncbi:MAG: glycosyltransferase, partial [Bacteroidia bacterium]
MFIKEDSFEEITMIAQSHKPISIIVPAFNEEKIIVKTVLSLLSLHYPEFEIIVVNDGSDDKTIQKLKNNFRLVETHEPQRKILKHKEIKNIFISV